MEAWIGWQWHRFALRRAGEGGRASSPALADARRAVELILRAGGAHQRVAIAAPIRVGGRRSAWQRIAGSGTRLPLPQLDDAVLALPERIGFFDDAALDSDLYLWWAALASCMDPRAPWVRANQEATEAALVRFGGLRARWIRLREAERALRGQPWPEGGQRAHEVAPVWTWIVPTGSTARPGSSDPAGGASTGTSTIVPGRRRAREHQPASAVRAPLLLGAKGESLRIFADAFAIDRADDDESAGDAAVAAGEVDAISLRRGGTPAARVRFDLDLPSAQADDRPLGPGLLLPEWDLRRRALVPDRVLAQRLRPRATPPWQPPPGLQALAARVRRRLEALRGAPGWQRGCADGEAIDLDALVRSRAGVRDAAAAAYLRRARARRSLATLLLADLSLSTDAYAGDGRRVVDVIRDALYVFAQALEGCGDASEMLGFSSVRRHLRLHEVKRFDEAFGPQVQARLGAIRPGYYTRLGAALRAGTHALRERPERTKLLLLLTDGKPHDLDGYDGLLGQRDTRAAVLEARAAGVLTFALAIDPQAAEAMPQLFGSTRGLHGRAGWAALRRPQELPARLAGLYAALTR